MKLLILSASTGGGHDMRAFALKDWWMGKGFEAEVFHPLENTFAGYRFGCQLYNLIQKKIPLLHYAYFHFLEYASIHRSSKRIIGSKICSKNFILSPEFNCFDARTLKSWIF